MKGLDTVKKLIGYLAIIPAFLLWCSVLFMVLVAEYGLAKWCYEIGAADIPACIIFGIGGFSILILVELGWLYILISIIKALYERNRV